MQLKIDFERAEDDARREQQRQEDNRRHLAEHLAAAGLGGLALELLVLAVNQCRLVAADGARRLIVQGGERAMAGAIGASKSGVHEALLALEARGLVRRFRGGYAVSWDAVIELPPLDPLAGAPTSGGKRSVGGRSAGPLGPSKENKYPPPPPSQETTQVVQPSALPPAAEAAAPGRAGGGWPWRVRWRELYSQDSRPLRSGVQRVWRTAVSIGWLPGEDPQAELAHVLALLLWLPSPQRKEAGVTHPIAWLLRALAGGPGVCKSWPGEDFFDEARDLVGKAGEEFLRGARELVREASATPT